MPLSLHSSGLGKGNPDLESSDIGDLPHSDITKEDVGYDYGDLKSSQIGENPVFETALDDLTGGDNLTTSGVVDPTPVMDPSYVGAFDEQDAPASAWLEKIIPVDPHYFKKLASSGLGTSSPDDHFTTLKPTAPQGTPDQTDHFCKAIAVTLSQPLNEGKIEKSIRQGITPAMGNRRWSVPYSNIPDEGALKELAYEKNMGAMEVAKFYNLATPEQMSLLDKLMNKSDDRDAWLLIQAVTGVKLQGDDFGSDEELASYRSKNGF